MNGTEIEWALGALYKELSDLLKKSNLRPKFPLQAKRNSLPTSSKIDNRNSGEKFDEQSAGMCKDSNKIHQVEQNSTVIPSSR